MKGFYGDKVNNKYGVKQLDGKIESVFFGTYSFMNLILFLYLCIFYQIKVIDIIIFIIIIIMSLLVSYIYRNVYINQKKRKPKKTDQWIPITSFVLILFFSFITMYMGFHISELTNINLYKNIGLALAFVIVIFSTVFLIIKE